MTDSGNPSDLQFPVSPEPRDFDVTHVVDKDALEFPEHGRRSVACRRTRIPAAICGLGEYGCDSRTAGERASA